MARLRLFLRTLKFFAGTALLTWLLCSPGIGLCALISWRVTAAFMLVVGFAAPLALLLISESEIPKLLGAQAPRSYGLRNSYEMAYAESGKELGRRPALLTYADPAPNVFVVRSTGKDGAILFSDGLIAILDEAELRSVLIRAIGHLLSSEVILQSACVLVLMWIQRLLARGSRDSYVARQAILAISAKQALRNLLLFPWLRFYSAMAERSVSDDAAALPKVGDHLLRAELLYGQRAALPGLVYLGIER